jgi:hypothetical protein
MAEILGTVASGVAVFQLSEEVGKLAIKLKSLWDEIDKVPEELRDMLDDLELLGLILGDLDRQLMGNTPSIPAQDCPSIHLSTKYCRKALDTLLSLANELDREISSRRGLEGNSLLPRLCSRNIRSSGWKES